MKPTSSLLALTGLALVTQSNAATTKKTTTQRPNIIYIMCDDMGYGDLGCYGQPYISTPRIDSMATEGMRFTQAYAGSPVSAPSRASFMTGQHSGHCEVRGNKEYWRDVPMMKYGENEEFTRVGQHPYDSAHIILPELLKTRGYTTGMFGKWAGGYEGSVSVPEKRGIDEFYGYICQYQAHLYYPNFLNRYMPQLGDTATVREVLEENIIYPQHGPGYEKRTQYSADLIHQHALDWLDRQSTDKPFFGIFTYTLPHAELVQPNDSILDGYRKKFTDDLNWYSPEWSRYNTSLNTHAQFAGMITRLDAYVGEILDKLKEKGLDDNTIVVFTSDNGPHEEGGADPTFFGRDGKLRGIKRQIHEGGIRVPFIVRWPGKVEAGSVQEMPVAFYDIMPTFAEAAGVTGFPDAFRNPAKEKDYFDGISFLPALLGQPQERRHEFLYWEFDETDQIGVRQGPWKLIVKKGVPHLYNLDNDIHEDRDVAAEHPEKVAELIEIVYREHTPSEHFSVTLPARP